MVLKRVLPDILILHSSNLASTTEHFSGEQTQVHDSWRCQLHLKCYISGDIYKTVQTINFKLSTMIAWKSLHLWVQTTPTYDVIIVKEIFRQIRTLVQQTFMELAIIYHFHLVKLAPCFLCYLYYGIEEMWQRLSQKAIGQSLTTPHSNAMACRITNFSFNCLAGLASGGGVSIIIVTSIIIVVHVIKWDEPIS